MKIDTNFSYKFEDINDKHGKLLNTFAIEALCLC